MKSDEVLYTALLLLLLICMLAVGVLAYSDGINDGRNEVANKVCVVMGYDYGEYDTESAQVMCAYKSSIGSGT